MKTALWAGIGLTGVALYGVIFRLYTWFKFVDPNIYFRSDYMTATTLSVFGGALAVVGFGILVIYMYRYHEKTVDETNDYFINQAAEMKAELKKTWTEREQLRRDGEALIREIKKIKKDKGLPDELKSQLEFFDERQKEDKEPSRAIVVLDPEKDDKDKKESPNKAELELERKTQEAKHKREFEEVRRLKEEVKDLKDDRRTPVAVKAQAPTSINIKQEGGCSGCLKWFVILSLSSAAIYAILMLGFCNAVMR